MTELVYIENAIAYVENKQPKFLTSQYQAFEDSLKRKYRRWQQVLRPQLPVHFPDSLGWQSARKYTNI